MKIPNNFLFSCLLLCSSGMLFCQSVKGTWQTIDDRNGSTKALVTIYEEGGRLYGYIKEVLMEGRENGVCTACDGELKDKPLTGMRILDGLRKTHENTWEGGKKALLDPEQGKYFRVRLWLHPENPNELKVRGYLFFLFRTQTWIRVTHGM